MIQSKVFAAGRPFLSTIDWPSTVCCVVFFVGCNFRCRFCFNAPILEFDDKYLCNITKVTTELTKQSYLVEGVIVTGGEPTLQPEPLTTIAEWARENSLLFGLMTNGTNSRILRKFLRLQLLDFVALDIKTVPLIEEYVKITQNKRTSLVQIKETVALLKKSSIQYEFRTTLVPQLVYKPEEIRQISDWVGADHFILQIFRPSETVLDPALRQVSFSEEELSLIREVGKQLGIRIR